MTEMRMFAGKCKCGRELNMRILDVKEDENDKKSKIVAWIIHGHCKKCKIVYAQGVFEGETKPIEDRDFIIEWDKKIKGTKPSELPLRKRSGFL